MKCRNCQFENREAARFCLKCGKKLAITCPQCKKELSLNAQFCDECGRRLEESFEKERRHEDTEGERKHITVLFSDLSGYTAMSEELDPEDIKEITSRIFGEVAQIVAQHDGFVEKYIGDAVVAIFGVPKAHEDDPLRAILVARDIHKAIDGLGRELEERAGRRLTFHTGITTGLVVTGEINLEKGTHGIAGDTINLASRLSSLARPGEILVSENTHFFSKGNFSFEKLQPVLIKGKAEPVTPYRLLEAKAEPVRGLAAQGIRSILVGRNTEVEAVRGCVNHLLDGRGGILSVIGEAGLGKSRLMAEIQHHFANENLLWLEGRCLSYGQKISYWPFREVFCQWAGVTDDDSDTQAWNKFERNISILFADEAHDVLPILASLIGLGVKSELKGRQDHLGGDAMGKQIYIYTRRFFESLAQRSQLVLIFEDLHWADESTILLIEHLFPIIDRVPLLICGVSRPEIGVPAARLRESAIKNHQRHYTEIRLNPLSLDECGDLMNNLVNIENLPCHTRQIILQKTDGNPFFVEEIMRSLLDSGVVRYENGHWRATSRIEMIKIPDTVQGVIMARVDRLDEEVKQILKAASVIGRAFLYRLLKEVTEAVRELDKHLDMLAAKGLIREKQKTPEIEYIFKHALVQESTYESILLKKRQELHSRVAVAIESLFFERLDEFSTILAYHFAKAERWEKAQEYLFKAGDQAGRIAADAEALTHYKQALETYTLIFGDKWDPIQRGILERKMGEAFFRLGEFQNAMDYIQRALTYFGRPRLSTSRWLVWPSILWEMGIQLGHQIFFRWITKKQFGLVNQVVKEVARVYEIVAMMEATSAPHHFLRTTLIRLNYSERRGYTPEIATEYASLGFIAFLFSFSRIERYFLKRSMTLAEETQHPVALRRAHMISSITEFNAGHLHRAIDHGSKAAEVCREEGYSNLSEWSVSNLFSGVANLFLGNFDVALRIAGEMIHTGEDANDPYVYSCGLYSLCEVQERKGEFEDCVTNLNKAICVLEAIPNHEGRVMAGCVLYKCYLRMGDIDKSLNTLTEADAYGAKHNAKLYRQFVLLGFFRIYLAAAEQANGRERKEWLNKAKGVQKKAFRLANLRRIALPETTRLQGIYEWLTGRHDSAQQYWQNSFTLAEAMGMRYELGMTHFEVGWRLQDRLHLQHADTIFEEIGADWDLRQTRKIIEPLKEKKEE